jgi:membrane associated rhomboid family serine protease
MLDEPQEPRRERMLNVPAVVVAFLAALALVHAVISLALTPDALTEFVLWFAFIPARYDAHVTPDVVFPGGIAADIWTFITYAFIHGDLSHLTLNAVALLAFGSPVARRFGTLRFLVFMAVTAAAGAAAHLVTHFGELLPIVGASAAISGCMAAATRFAFQRGGPLGPRRDRDDGYRVPAVSLLSSLRDKRVLVFLLAWFGINLLFGIGVVGAPGLDQPIAWEAHIGGFLAGLFGFAIFDPVPRGAPANPRDDDPPPTIH